jgi:hypothetical protein
MGYCHPTAAMISTGHRPIRPSAPITRRRWEDACWPFNQLDNILGSILKTVLIRLERHDLVEACITNADFNKRVLVLDLLKHCTEGTGLIRVPTGPLRVIAGQRNLLAHAHFDDDRGMSDDYRLIDRKAKLAQKYSAERIARFVLQIREATQSIQSAEAYYQFCDAPIPSEPA